MTPDDKQLLGAFDEQALSLDDWNQRTHVALAWIHLEEHGFPEALARLRTGIQRYNRSKGIEESSTSGYNETTTVALLTLVDSVRVAYAGVLPSGCSEQFCETHPQLMSKHILRLFYSPERRMHPEAKVRFVEPDLAPLPTIPSEP